MGNVVFDLVHGLDALAGDVVVGLPKQRLGLRLRPSEDLLTLLPGSLGGGADDAGGFLVGGQQLFGIGGLVVLGRLPGFLGGAVQLADLALTLGNDLLHGLKKESLKQIHLEQQVADLCDKSPTVK